MDDRSIIELFLRRDENAISELKNKYEKLFLTAAGKILSQREDIDECVNTAFFNVWNSIPPDEPENLSAYLCRIVKNKAIDMLRHNSAGKRNDAFTVSLDELAECIPDTSVDVSAAQLAGAISSFLRTQDEKHRKVFVRRYWYGDTVAEIAGRYGLNEKTVATYLFRTRNKLKAYLQKEGYYNG